MRERCPKMEEHRIDHGEIDRAGGDARERLAEAERARRALVAELSGLGATMTAAINAEPGFMPCGRAFAVVIDGLSAAAASDDPGELARLAAAARERSEHVSAHRGVSRGDAASVRAAMGQSAGRPTLRAALLAGIMGIALAARRGMAAGEMSDEVNLLLVNALDALSYGEDSEYVQECIGRCSAVAARAFALAG